MTRTTAARHPPGPFEWAGRTYKTIHMLKRAIWNANPGWKSTHFVDGGVIIRMTDGTEHYAKVNQK